MNTIIMRHNCGCMICVNPPTRICYASEEAVVKLPSHIVTFRDIYVMWLSIGTPNNFFSICSNGKLIVLGVP